MKFSLQDTYTSKELGELEDNFYKVRELVEENNKLKAENEKLKEQIKKLKRVNRDIDSEIFKLNANEIELSFDYEELDLLS